LLRVRIAGAGPGALEELGARLLSPRGSDLLQVSAFRAGWDLESAVRGLEVKKQIDILSASHLLTGNNREVSVQAGAHWSGVRGSAGGPGTPAQCGVEIQFMPSIHRDGTLRLRVQPEATSPHGEGVATRRIQTEVELSDGQSFLVTGLFEPGEGAFVLERLFPAHATESRNKELVVLVTPQLVPLTQSSRHTAALMKKP
jgi:type II secretory pathway component HofQ